MFIVLFFRWSGCNTWPGVDRLSYCSFERNGKEFLRFDGEFHR